MTLNLKSDAGKSMFLGLVKKADVVIENYRPGVMDKLGLGYDVLKEVNPRIIYGAVSGFGAWGPYSQRPGYDILAQAMGGLMSLTGEKGGQPTRAGNAMGDMLAGMNLTIGVLAALHARTLTGKGQRVDVSLVDSIVVSLENAFTRYWNTGELYERNGNAYAALAPYDTFEASDGLVVIACGNQSLYEKFCKKVANKLEWVEDSRFLTNILRVENMDALEELINSWSVHYTVEEITNRCLEAGVPAGPVYDLSQIVKDPHIVEARDMFPIVHHPVIGDMPVNGDAIKMSDTNPEIVKASPLLGEDNQSIYQEFLELSEEDLVRLKEEGVI